MIIAFGVVFLLFVGFISWVWVKERHNTRADQARINEIKCEMILIARTIERGDLSETWDSGIAETQAVIDACCAAMAEKRPVMRQALIHELEERASTLKQEYFALLSPEEDE